MAETSHLTGIMDAAGGFAVNGTTVINSSGVVLSSIDVTAAGVTTGTALALDDADALTTGSIANFTSNSSDTGTRSLVIIKQDHASATGATAVTITQDSTAKAVQITTTAAGNAQAVVITSSATTVTSGVIGITGAAVTTGCGIKITLAALTTGAAIDTTGLAANTQVLNVNSSTGSTAAPQTNAPTGFFKIGVAGTDRWVPFYSST